MNRSLVSKYRKVIALGCSTHERWPLMADVDKAPSGSHENVQIHHRRWQRGSADYELPYFIFCYATLIGD